MRFAKLNLAYLILASLPLAAVPVAAVADCLTADDLAAGIEVTVEGGFKAVYRGRGFGDVTAAASHVKGGDGYSWDYRLDRGLFVIEERITEHEAGSSSGDAVVVGGNDGGTITLSMIPQKAVPKQLADWTSKVNYRREQDGPSIGPQPVLSGKLAAVVQVLPEKTVNISGCAYRIAPVETRLEMASASNLRVDGVALAEAGMDPPEPGTALLVRRQIYFLDLGFGVVTREGDEVDAMPVIDHGITGMARAG